MLVCDALTVLVTRSLNSDGAPCGVCATSAPHVTLLHPRLAERLCWREDFGPDAVGVLRLVRPGGTR